ncbi:hypothetical protein AaE_010738, partial [Aphanomyces astaci]
MDELIAGVQGCMDDLRSIEATNQQHGFKATFWQQNSDFNLGRDVLIAAGGSISSTVTKFSLVLGKETVASDAYSVCHTMFQPCEQLLAALKVAVFAGAGYALTKELCASVHRIFANVLDLSTRLHAKDLGRVPELTGRIWDACAALETLSKSNLISTKRVMLQTVAVLNDTVQELQGDVAAAKDALDNTIDDHDHLEQRNVELEDDLDFDMGSQTLTANELRQLQACVD